MSNGEIITKTEAADMIDQYQADYPNGVISHLFDADLITTMLGSEGVAGIRIYHGVDEEGKQVLILVCADANGDDMADLTIVERSDMCPNNCSYSSYFNH